VTIPPTGPPAGGAGDRTNRPHPRGNGLPAEHFAALLDVDPRVAELLLEALRRAGIAAYVAPTPGSVGGYLDVHLPDRPTDRLWVDGARRVQAGEVVRQELASSSTDVATPAASAEPTADPFEQIVAGFADPWPTGSGEVPWPAAEDIPAEPTGTVLPPSRIVRYPVVERRRDDALPEAVENYLDEHFVPDPPPPLPRPSIATFWALVGLVGGLVVLVGSSILRWQLDLFIEAAALFGILGGFATLVWRMHDRSDDDDQDDGAVV
jgi:hypothetical protein